MIYLYDPRTNVTRKTTYEELEGITGRPKSSLMSARSRKGKLKAIDCYITDENTTIEQRREWYAKETYSDEAWLTIKGSGDQFKISNYGRLKRVYKTTEKFLLPFQRKGRGNLFIKCRYQGKYGEYKVGHLVAAHFIREKQPGENVIRKNGIITDDFVGNLEYASKEKLGKMTGYKSKSKPVVQVDVQTLEIINEFRSAREAGRKCNFSYQAILDRCNGKYPYRHDEITFMFEEDYERKVILK